MDIKTKYDNKTIDNKKKYNEVMTITKEYDKDKHKYDDNIYHITKK